jgi:hypothetical protein
MANVLGKLFGDIADAIREKTGDTATMKPAEFPAKISGIETDDGVDPYYQRLAEALLTRDASLLTGDSTALELKGFKLIGGGVLGNVPEYAYAGFKDVETISISDTLFVYPNAFVGDAKLKILDVTASSVLGSVGFFGNSLLGCTALESVIVRDGGAGLTNVNFLTTDTAGNNYGGVGANSTFYVYVPAEYYDAIVANVNSLTYAAVPASRYRKLEDYPEVDKWNETYTVNFYDGDKLVDTKTVRYGQSATSRYVKSGYTLVGWTPEPTNVTSDMDCYGSWSISFASASWETIAEISEAGNAASTFAIGDTKTFTCDGYNYTAEIAAFDADELADGSGTAGITLIIRGLSRYSVAHYSGATGTKVYPWSTSTLRSYCNETIYNGIQEDLRSIIKPVTKRTIVNWNTEVTTDYCWPLSCYEVGYSVGYETPSAQYSSLFYSDASRKRALSSGAASVWNLRSVNGSQMNYYVNANGKVTYGTGQKNARYFVFGFCI